VTLRRALEGLEKGKGVERGAPLQAGGCGWDRMCGAV